MDRLSYDSTTRNEEAVMQLPDYLIYDELERERQERRRQDDERPRLEVPRYMPYWPEDEAQEEEEEKDRGVVIIQM